MSTAPCPIPFDPPTINYQRSTSPCPPSEISNLQCQISPRPDFSVSAFSLQPSPVAPSPPQPGYPQCRGRGTGCPVPPSQIPAGPIRGTGLFVLARSLRPQEGWPVWFRLSYGTGCLCELRQHVGPFPSFGAGALPLDTMSRSDSRSTFRPNSSSLLVLTCLALAMSAAGILRASSVSCVVFGARHALRPRQATRTLTLSVTAV